MHGIKPLPNAARDVSPTDRKATKSSEKATRKIRDFKMVLEVQRGFTNPCYSHFLFRKGQFGFVDNTVRDSPVSQTRNKDNCGFS